MGDTYDWLQTFTSVYYCGPDYGQSVTPSSATDWGTVPTTPSTSLTASDWIGAGLSGTSTAVAGLAESAGASMASSYGVQYTVPALVADLPAAVGTAISVGSAVQNLSNENYYEAGHDLVGVAGAIVGSEVGLAAGAAVGAAIGSELAPVVGTVIGAAVGAYVGYAGYETAFSNDSLAASYTDVTTMGSWGWDAGYVFAGWGS